MNVFSKFAWEEWQLTAYLLQELDSEDAAKIKAASEADPELARKLAALAETIGMVQSALAAEPISASDQAILARLKGSTAHLNSPDAVEHVPQVVIERPKLLPRLASRWENWATLAGLILIAALLVNRQYNGQSIAFMSGTQENLDVRSAGDGDAIEILEKNLAQERAAAAAASANSGQQPADGGSPPAVVLSASPGPESKVLAPFADAGSPQVPADVPSTVDAFAYQSIPLPSAPAANSSAANSAAGGSFTLPPNSAPLPTSGVGGYVPGDSYADQLSGHPGNSALAMNTSGPERVSELARGGIPDGPLSSGEELGVTEHMDAKDGRSKLAMGIRMSDVRPLVVDAGGDRFAPITDNPFKPVSQDPLSTFSIDVDTASFSKTRQYLMEYNQAPPPAAVRLEEFINSFDYQYAGPQDDKPFAAALAVSDCPWTPEHKLVRIALQAKQVDIRERPKANLVFLLDVSGSMNEPNKLPLVKESIRLLTYQLQENDRVALVVYAGAAGCVLSSTPGNRQDEILSAIERLSAGGSTNGGQGIQLAYSIARDHFIPGGINRVILCTDGDFNVGLTGNEQLVNLVQKEAAGNIFLTVLGYGMGNTNDAMMEQIADKGNGVYGFVDSHREAQRQMVKQLAGNLMTVAKDVKIQVEFNPQKIREYRLLGYENRVMAHADFNNDKKDAGEIGAGHRVTALYEVALVGSPEPKPAVENLRYQPAVSAKAAEVPPASPPVPAEDGQVSNELLAVKLRYKQPEANESELLVFPLEDKKMAFAEADVDFRWSAAMAEFGMLLRNSPHRGQSNWSQLFDRARQAVGSTADPARIEALEMIRKASQLVPR